MQRNALKCIAPRPMARARLLAVPWAGGGVSAFRHWPQELPDWVELWGLRVAGHEGRLQEGLPTSLVATAEEAARVCSEWAIPFVVLGHSLGAWIAYEIVRSLAAFDTTPVKGLVVSGMRSPQTAASGDAVIANLPDVDFLAEVDRRYGGLGPDVRAAPDLLQAVLPILRADINMLERYTFEIGDPVHVPIHIMVGRDDPLTSNPDSVAGWKDVTTAAVTMSQEDGGHFFVLSEKSGCMEEVRRVLRTWLTD